MPSGMGYGAQAGLQDVLKRLFLEAQQKQQADLAQAKLDEEIRQANMGNEIQQGQLGQGQQRIDLGRDELGLSREKFGEDTRRYDAEAPSREADVAYKGALTGELIRKPEAEQQDRDFTTGRDKTLHGYRLGQIGAEASNRQERMVQVQGPQGAPIWVPESQAAGQPAAQAARAVTGQERQSLAYYNRAKQASDDIAKLEADIAKAGIGSQLQLQHAPNMLQTSSQQAYRQGQRAFTEARLRKESGAAIPQGEYENDARTYFAQPGDSPETIAQKQRARATVLEGLKFSSGKAFNEFYGDTGAAPAAGGGGDAAARAAELLKKYGGGN
jgi:hypothetical protein